MVVVVVGGGGGSGWWVVVVVVVSVSNFFRNLFLRPKMENLGFQMSFQQYFCLAEFVAAR